MQGKQKNTKKRNTTHISEFTASVKQEQDAIQHKKRKMSLQRTSKF